jgi:transcriptional regulator with XRE-family HTH domain
LPFCHLSLKTPKPLPPAYPKSLKTLGDHLRTKRLDLGLLQKQVGEQIGVCEEVIYLWESNARTPLIRYIPKIIQFLGYEPYAPIGSTLSEKLKTCRTRLGISQGQLAKMLGVDVSTLGKWERGESHPTQKSLKIIESFIG